MWHAIMALMLAAAAEPDVVSEARAFMEAYGRDLAAGERARLAARYDRRGAWILGGGRKAFESHAQITAFYGGKAWTRPAAFAWENLSFEPAGPDAVVVAGQFLWTEAGKAPRLSSYTGLLVRQDGELRIRLEDEDAAPEPKR